MMDNALALTRPVALAERQPAAVRRIVRPMPASPMVLRRFEENLALMNRRIDTLMAAISAALASRATQVPAAPPVPLQDYQTRQNPQQQETETRINRSSLLDIFD